ncbi:MAG: PHP domain-containing protein [Planctomycetes bacterium]|nr:PHP domain-containing protein [Planctomycetota bacterium]
MSRRVLSCIFAAALSAGCVCLPFGGNPNAGPATRPSPMGHGLREHRAVFHVHCHLSHDSEGTVEEIAAAARSLGIDTVILTDHYEPGNIARAPRGVIEGVLFLPGVEVRGAGGSVLAFPLQEDFAKGLSHEARLVELSRQGAVNVLGHVEEIEDWSLGPYAAFEVYNLHAEFKAASAWGIAWRFAFLPADAFFESSVRIPSANLATWDRELARGRRLAALAGHDAHQNVKVLGVTLGTYAELFRLFSNHVLAKERTVEAIAEGVRAGRTFFSFDFLGDATGFAVSYGSQGAPADGRAILGDDAPWRPEHTLDVLVPSGRGGGVAVRVLRDGVPCLETDARGLSAPLPGPGVYRVEVHAGGRLWIVGSPMYIKG